MDCTGVSRPMCRSATGGCLCSHSWLIGEYALSLLMLLRLRASTSFHILALCIRGSLTVRTEKFFKLQAEMGNSTSPYFLVSIRQQRQQGCCQVTQRADKTGSLAVFQKRRVCFPSPISSHPPATRRSKDLQLVRPAGGDQRA